MIKEKLWIISELFPPDETSTSYIMGKIANTMVCKYDVHVICGPSVYDKNKKSDSNGKLLLDNSIEVLRVKGINENKANKLSRARKFLLMSWRLYKVARKKIEKGDNVLMVTNPFPLIIMMAYLKKYCDFSLSMLVHDIYPEGLFTEMHVPKPIYCILKKMFDKAYSSTDLLISIGRDMSEVLIDKCKIQKHIPKIEIIENWSDIQTIQPDIYNNEKRLVVQYAGNVGRAQGVEEFVDVLRKVNNDFIEFSIWGTGSAEADLIHKVDQYGMRSIVKFNGPYLRSQQINVLNSCSIAVVCLVDGMYGLGVPSKSYNILAAGKPILYIGERNTEIWRMLKENGNGFCFEPSDKEELKKFLCSLTMQDLPKLQEMGRISRKLAEEKYSEKIALRKFLEFV